jgi:hypothetical protein
MRSLFYSLITLFPFIVHASLIDITNTDTEYLSGKNADLQGLQWLSLDLTEGVTRTSIESGFGGYFSDNWRYASREETETLLGSLWGGTASGWANNNFDGANWFINTFGLSTSWPNSNEVFTNFLFGETFECSAWSGYTCAGSVKTYNNSGVQKYGEDVNGSSILSYSAYSGAAGYLHEKAGLNVGYSNQNEVKFTYINGTGTGSLLVKSLSVPEPSIIALLLIGFIGIYILRHKARSPNKYSEVNNL